MSTLDPHCRPLRTPRLAPIQLIERVYEAAAEPSGWPGWFDALATAIDHRASNVVLRGFGPTRYVSLDEPTSGFDTLNPVGVFEHKALSKHHFEMAYVAGDLVEDWSQLPVGAASSGVQVFSDDTRSLEAHGRAILRDVLPHLYRALVLHFRYEELESERDALSTCLDELSMGMVLLDAAGRVLYANQAARECLDGRYELVVDRGKLSAREDVEPPLRRILGMATSGRQRSLRGLPLPGGATLWLRGVAPGRATGYIASEREERYLSPELLASAFDLSPAEARVGSRFARGQGVDAIAGDLDLSVHTVRTHLKRIQSKTGTHRQVTLVRRMLESIPPVNP